MKFSISGEKNGTFDKYNYVKIIYYVDFFIIFMPRYERLGGYIIALDNGAMRCAVLSSHRWL